MNDTEFFKQHATPHLFVEMDHAKGGVQIRNPIMAKGGKMINWPATAKELAARLHTSTAAYRAMVQAKEAQSRHVGNLETVLDQHSGSLRRSRLAHAFLSRHWAWFLLPKSHRDSLAKALHE